MQVFIAYEFNILGSGHMCLRHLRIASFEYKNAYFKIYASKNSLRTDFHSTEVSIYEGMKKSFDREGIQSM